MSYWQHHFTAHVAVHRIGRLRYRALFAPPALLTALPFDAQPRLRIVGEIADHPFEGAWQSAGEGASGGRYLLLSAAFCRAAGLAIGDAAEVRFNVAASDTVPVPEELQQALAANRRAQAAWEALTPGRRRGLAHTVASARTEPTRRRRAEALAEALATGAPLPGVRPPRTATAPPDAPDAPDAPNAASAADPEVGGARSPVQRGARARPVRPAR